MEVEEEVVENPLTTAFWINVVLVAISLVVIIRLTLLTSSEEPEVFDPYATLGISVVRVTVPSSRHIDVWRRCKCVA